MEPGLRDAGQVLGALSLAGTDAAVAQAAQNALNALDEMVLASSQGSLRAGAQMGFHIEQTLGSNLSAERLLAYRGRASQLASWVVVVTGDQLTTMSTYEIALALPGATSHRSTGNIVTRGNRPCSLEIH